MNFRLRIPLQATPEQAQRLLALQRVFAAACNVLAPLARQTGVWSRVGLHQMCYRPLRAQFPGLGSQMVCNAIYSVSRACRLVYQYPTSPFNVSRHPGQPLPLLRFSDDAPVYFDRHTLSLRNGGVSMFTLDGRMRFHLPLTAEDERRFHEDHLLEIMLAREPSGLCLQFSFGQAGGADPVDRPGHLPHYLVVLPEGEPSALPLPIPTAAARETRLPTS